MIKDYPKAIVTKDGTSVLLRPATKDDEQRLSKFFSRIPAEERWFLREKLTDPDLLTKWLEGVDYESLVPIIAVREDTGEIIANVRLYRSTSASMRHVAHMRVMVLPDYRHLKVGSWMILDTIKLAMDLGIEKLVGEFVGEKEEPAMNAARKMAFQQEAVLKGYVRDLQGVDRDLIIMVKNLRNEWSDF
jgi:acetyltransferase